MLTPCVGREGALDRVRSLLAEGRWVTVTGAPGCGKTLLARHAAAAHPRAVWVSGRALPQADAIVTAGLDALGADVAPGDSPFLALKRALDDQDVLLVLDGVDSVDGLGALCDELVESTTTFRLLVGALRPDSGRGTIAGYDLLHEIDGAREEADRAQAGAQHDVRHCSCQRASP